MKNTSDYSSRFRILKGGKISLVVSAMLMSATLVHAAPTGGLVTTGSASINQAGSVTTITQSTNKASINWQDFSIGKNETVNFVQPSSSSVTLNRVVGTSASLIEGAMNANGQVFLLNPNGVLFSKDATVNVGGLVASTLNISDENFQAGNYTFEGNSQNSVLNMGTITTNNGGYVAMMGKTVKNEGTIVATMGNVQLAGGDKISLNLNGNSLVKLTIDEGTFNALVENKGIIKADGGQVYLTTQALNTILDGMVNNSGIIEASSLTSLGGKIALLGDTVVNSGSLLATGKTAGGEILVGGDWQGSNSDIYGQALHTTLTDTSIINASAINNANGGKIVIWSNLDNGITVANGSIKAEGGLNTGDGGKIETSGHQLTIVNGTKVSTKAPYGTNGIWLLDPANVNIGYVSQWDTLYYCTSTISSDDLQNALSAGDVVITTTPSSTGVTLGSTSGNPADGIINIFQSNLSVSNSLTLTATNGINFYRSNMNVENDGNGKLILNTGTGNLYFDSYGTHTGTTSHITFDSSAAAILQNLVINNESYNIVTSRNELINITTGELSQKFALGGTISWAGAYNIASYNSNPFTGKLEGLGNSITNITIQKNGVAETTGVGMFSSINGATISNLVIGSTSGSEIISDSRNTGGLAGIAINSTIRNVIINLDVTSTQNNVGGLVGFAQNTTFDDVIANGDTKGKAVVGGIVGRMEGGSVDYGTNYGRSLGTNAIGGMIDGSDGNNPTQGGYIGGIVGNAIGSSAHPITLTNVQFSGSAVRLSSGNADASDPVKFIGGIVGLMNGYTTVSQAYVYAETWLNQSPVQIGGRGEKWVGGIAGLSNGIIEDAWIDSTYISGSSYVGGIAGGLISDAANTAKINRSFVSANISGNDTIGGLIGFMYGNEIRNSYFGPMTESSTTDLHDNNYWDDVKITGLAPVNGVGGLVGQALGANAILYSYFAAPIYSGSTLGTNGSSAVGGLVGGAPTGNPTVTSSYWDTELSNVSQSHGGVGKTTAELNQKSTFAGWDIEEGNDHIWWPGIDRSTTKIWHISSGYAYPTFETYIPDDSSSGGSGSSGGSSGGGSSSGGSTGGSPSGGSSEGSSGSSSTDNIVSNIVTTIVNSTTVTPPSVVIVSPAPQPSVVQTQTTQLLQNIMPQSNGEHYNLVGTTDGMTPIQTVSMKQLQKASKAQGVNDVRVALGQESFVELINGGVNLPIGVSQEFYVVNNNNQEKKN